MQGSFIDLFIVLNVIGYSNCFFLLKHNNVIVCRNHLNATIYWSWSWVEEETLDSYLSFGWKWSWSKWRARVGLEKACCFVWSSSEDKILDLFVSIPVSNIVSFVFLKVVLCDWARSNLFSMQVTWNWQRERTLYFKLVQKL